LRFVAMRRTGPRRDAVVVTTAFHLDEAKVSTKWTLKLKKGTYHFVCDPHRTILDGVLKVT
jgi:plastocyanin